VLGPDIFEYHFRIADDGIERCAQIMAEPRFRFLSARRGGPAVDQAIDEAIQLPCGGADPLQVGLHTG
jgi:hypothetical protein